MPSASKSSSSKVSRTPRDKVPKDPNAPMKPPSAFFIYLKEHQPNVRREMERGGLSISNADVAKECGRRWQNLDPELKERYHEDHQVHKQRYIQEMQVYMKSPDAVAAASVSNIAKNARNTDADTGIPQMFKDYFKFLEENWSRVALGMPRESPAMVQQMIWNIWSGSRTVTKDTTATVDTNFNIKNIKNIKNDSKLDVSFTVPTPVVPCTPSSSSETQVDPSIAPPKSAFQFFVEAIKEHTHDEQEEPITALCQEKWTTMTEEERNCFVVMELEDCDRFQKEAKVRTTRRSQRIKVNSTPATPAPTPRKRKRLVREAAVKAVKTVAGVETRSTPRQIKQEKQHTRESFSNDDILQQESFDAYEAAVRSDIRGLSESDEDKGKLMINENYYSSDEY